MKFLGKAGAEIQELLEKNKVTLKELEGVQVDTDDESMFQHLKLTGAIKFIPQCDSWVWMAGGDTMNLDDVQIHLLDTGVVVYETKSDKNFWVEDIKCYLEKRRTK